MLAFLGDRASDRKLRLAACAWCRLNWHLLTDERSRTAVKAGERLADQLLPEDERGRVLDAVVMVVRGTLEVQDFAEAKASSLARRTVENAREQLIVVATHYFGFTRDKPWPHRCDLFRDIFGNPFGPLPPRPEAIAPLAEEIYGGRWELMPLLGEWLQEHAFWAEGEHCLDPRVQHVKGCWVVDWVTGRE
jgi:hypothetical protein